MSRVKGGFNPEYDDNKKTDMLYIGRSNSKPDGSSYRSAEVIIDQTESYLSEKNKEHNSIPVEFDIKDEVILQRTAGGQQKIYCWLLQSKDEKWINGLHISRRTNKGVYGSQEITLSLDGTIALKKFLDNLFQIDLKNNAPFRIPLSDLSSTLSVNGQIISKEDFSNLVEANIESVDDFYKLLSIKKMELAIIRLEEIINGTYEHEIDIQHFLKDNIWMFGNEYVWVVQNEMINSSNILDMAPRNIESYVDIIEVKLPREQLFNYDHSHKNYYATSKLTKAIAQTQNYIYELENKSNDELYQQDNNCKIIKPRGIILYGGYTELTENKRKYLRILNDSLSNITIITYKQLLEKAKNTISFIKNNNLNNGG